MPDTKQYASLLDLGPVIGLVLAGEGCTAACKKVCTVESQLYVRLSVVSPIGAVSSRILYMALYGSLFSFLRPSQFYVQIFESRLGRITEIPL